MNASSTFLSLLLLPFAFLSPQDTFRQRYETAEAHARAGNLAAAEAEYKIILAEGYRRLGRIYSALKKHEQAIPAVEAAANYQPDSGEALIDLAIVYFEAAQFDKALQPLGKAVTLNPRNANAHGMLGKTYFALRNYEKAAAELNTALELAPNDFDTNFTLAIAYLQQRQSAQARRVFDRMIAQFGDQPQLHILIGRTFREAGLLPEAIDEFKKAIALKPTYPRAHYNLGLAYLMNEGASALAHAEEEFKAELVSNPDEFFANYYLGIVYIFHRKWELAINFLKKASQRPAQQRRSVFSVGPGLSGVTEARSGNRGAQEGHCPESRSGPQQVPGDYRALPTRPVPAQNRAGRSGAKRVAASVETEGPSLRDGATTQHRSIHHGCVQTA